MSEAIELFHVHSVAPKLAGHRDVRICWLVSSRPQPLGLSYADFVEGYNEADSWGRPYQEDAIDELFTRAEAEALASYLKEHYDDKTVTIEKAALPFPSNVVGLSVMPAGGAVDFLLIAKNKAYSLPFEVEGYFDTRSSERLSFSSADIEVPF